MPTPRVGMRKIKECLRLKLECGLSNEQVARALGLSKGVVGKYVGRARVRTQTGPIRAKTGTRTTLDLVRRVAQLPPMVSSLRAAA